MQKYAAGTKYALRAQKKQVMARASRLVVDSNKKLLQTFQNEACCLLDQVESMKYRLAEKEAQCLRMLELNYD